MEMDNYECPICLTLIVEPIKISCSHVLCLTCLEKMLITGKFQCPLDRSNFDIKKDLTFDTGLFEKVKKEKDFKERALALLTQRNKQVNKVELKLTYGNEHESVPSQDENGNRHKWTAFVRLKKTDAVIKNLVENFSKKADLKKIISYTGKEEVKIDELKLNFENLEKKLIDNVVFQLHPTFNPPSVKVEKAPFELGRIGWGTFDIRAKVTFKKELKRETLNLEIPLSFSKKITEYEETWFLDPEFLIPEEKKK